MAFILIVDDSDDMTPLEIALTSNGGPRVVVLRDGRLALKLLQTDPPDLAAVITDLHLPFVDGFDLVAAIRAHDRFGRLPVIVISGDSDPAGSPPCTRVRSGCLLHEALLAGRSSPGFGRSALCAISGCFFSSSLCSERRAQEDSGSTAVMKQVLQRLDTLEKENKELMEEIRALRQQVAESRPAPAAVPKPLNPQQAPLDERVSVEEQRTAEQAQTKVEAAHKFPIQLNGMLLFNAFGNSANDALEYSGNYNLLTGPSTFGATVRQTLLGLDFQGPHSCGDGRSMASCRWISTAVPLTRNIPVFDCAARACLLNWKNRSFFVGQDKPLISPYQPDSFAEVGNSAACRRGQSLAMAAAGAL